MRSFLLVVGAKAEALQRRRGSWTTPHRVDPVITLLLRIGVYVPISHYQLSDKADHRKEQACYTLLLDKWIDGQPSNNDFFGLRYEYDYRETQLRAGGDALGLMDERGLDYIQGMGYNCIYIAGTNFVNMPWQSDGASNLCFDDQADLCQVIPLSISPSWTRIMARLKSGLPRSTPCTRATCMSSST